MSWLSVREVREATGVGKTAVCEYVNRAKVLGITWPIPPEIGDAELERLLFTPAGFHEGSTKTLPDWAKVHEELKRRGVTLMILWEEHRAEHTDGHGYSRFCALYGEWRKRLAPTMRQTHVAGHERVAEILVVDDHEQVDEHGRKQQSDAQIPERIAHALDLP